MRISRWNHKLCMSHVTPWSVIQKKSHKNYMPSECTQLDTQPVLHCSTVLVLIWNNSSGWAVVYAPRWYNLRGLFIPYLHRSLSHEISRDVQRFRKCADKKSPWFASIAPCSLIFANYPKPYTGIICIRIRVVVHRLPYLSKSKRESKSWEKNDPFFLLASSNISRDPL